MRRFVTLLLVTPLLASCSDSVTPVAPSGAKFSIEESQQSDAWTESAATDDWTEDSWTLAASSVVASAEESPLQSAPGDSAVMTFGNPQAGTSFVPAGAHDQSFHGRDRIIPGAVTIDAGQKVVFHMNVGHRVAIYKPGVRPEDINAGTGTFVLDPTNRQALQAVPVPVLYYRFLTPGRYLVICAIRRHFVDAKMYGWIHVR